MRRWSLVQQAPTWARKRWMISFSPTLCINLNETSWIYNLHRELAKRFQRLQTCFGQIAHVSGHPLQNLFRSTSWKKGFAWRGRRNHPGAGPVCSFSFCPKWNDGFDFAVLPCVKRRLAWEIYYEGDFPTIGVNFIAFEVQQFGSTQLLRPKALSCPKMMLRDWSYLKARWTHFSKIRCQFSN